MNVPVKILAPLISLFFLTAQTAFAGVTPSLSAERPREESFRAALKKELSCLSLSIEASTDDLARTLNQSVRHKLYTGSTGTRGLSADIVRNGPIAVSAADNFIYVSLPVSMTLSFGMFEAPAIALKLRFRGTARVTPDWRIRAEVHYLGLSDLMAEETRLGPISLKPRSIVEGITQPVQLMLSDLVSAKVNEMFPLKSRVAEVWNAARKPVLLDRSYSAWLSLSTREVMLSPLSARDNRVRVNVGINAFAELVVGPEPAVQPAAPLPDLKMVNGIDRNFRIALNADLYYRDLIAVAAPLLVDKKFESDGKTIIVKAFDIYGNGERLVVEVETEGALDGVIYLTCKPGFDPRTNIFSVEDLDFDIQTESLLVKSADWLLHSTFKSMIRERLNMDLTKRLEQSRETARKAIAQLRLADHVLLKGDLRTLKFNDALVQKERISIQVSSEGEAAIIFQ